MKFEVYCDESNPDLFWTQAGERPQYLLFGSLWLNAELRPRIKEQIKSLKAAHSYPGEIKWHKVHAGRLPFYRDLIDLFFSHGLDLRFRCIAIPVGEVNMILFHSNDRELGYYKFYYQMLKHWIYDFNEYRIYCDEKTNRLGDRLKTLRRTLDLANATSQVLSVQALPSKEVVLIQLTDFLLGAVSSRLNGTVATDGTKDTVIRHLEARLDVRKLAPTPKSEPKFNIFRIRLEGGW